MQLVIGNKAYSSWSLRPWLLMRHLGLPFDEVVIPMAQPETRAAMLAYAPTGKVPVLVDGEERIWETIAIVETLAERFPDRGIWPADPLARAHARALCAEMHAGFGALRGHLPCQFQRPVRKRELTPEAAADVARIIAAWSGARGLFSAGGPFLFGAFSAADAMFAPVVNRLHVYDVEVPGDIRAYMDAIMALPAWQQWIREGAAEPWRIAHYDAV
jgi:glutathione S-transferase